MPTLDELFNKYSITPSAGPTSGPRTKLLAQADRMLKELKESTSENDMDGTSSQYWWAPQSVSGQRRVSMRYGGKIVENTSVYVDNSLKAITDHITVLRKIIEESDDATWASEEARRQKK
ncbi:MAG: hypothetical protein ACKVJ2_11900 [Pseudomonadales bacterium]|jgi:DNA polymerase II small subunit/DNA polymerase delta subunit B|tara:strand:+ start:1136 stop:1495 length:360 start_codon:yes stop_codon:yes gene_type:complete